MVVCRRGLYGVWGLLFLAAQFWGQGNGFSPPATAPNSLPATTEGMSFFQKIYQAAKGLMGGRISHAATKPTANGLPVPPSPTRKPAESPPLQTIGFDANLTFSLRVLDGKGRASVSSLWSPLEAFFTLLEAQGKPLEPEEEDFGDEAVPEVHPEGSVIHVEASIQASPGLFPKLFIEDCYGADAPHQSHARRVDIIVNNHGCLHAGTPEITWFRKTDSSIMLKLPAFLLTDDSEEIYLHCLLTAWSQKLPTTPGKKMCLFDSTTSRWKNLDELSKSSVCHCCDSYCHQEPPPHGNLKGFPGEGIFHRELLGPLKVHKKDVSWLEGKCQTMKRMLLVSVAFVCSCILAAIFVGVLVALVLAVLRYSGLAVPAIPERLRRIQKGRPLHTELQTMVGACIETEEIEKESSMDYCKLNSQAPEKE